MPSMPASFTQRSTGEEVVKALSQNIDGKTIVITGPSTGGIGAETVTALAYAKPKRLILTGRTEAKISPVIQKIEEINTDVKVDYVNMDLADQSSIRAAAKEINGLVTSIDVLINNAGVMCTMPYKTTKEGIEMQFGTNHIGHFLFTNLLMEKILAAPKPARIVNVASTGYTLSDLPFDDINWNDGKDYHPWLAYAGSKTANILFTVYLAEKLKNKGVLSFALQPGMPQSDIGRELTEEGPASMGEAVKIATRRSSGVPYDAENDMKSLEQAASTSLYASFEPSLKDFSGIFLRNCAPYEVLDYAKDPQDAEKLWKMSESLVHQKFDL